MSQLLRKIESRVSCGECSLAELCLPRGLAHEELEFFEDAVSLKGPVAKGDHLYDVGTPMDAIFAVKSGSFKSQMITADGDEHITGFYLPGELIGFDGLSSRTHQCTVVALERSSVCELPVADLESLSVDLPSLQREMFRFASEELNDAQRMLLLVGKRPVGDRLAVFLLSIAERIRRRGGKGEELTLTMSRHDLANYLSMAPETISRLFKQFEDNRLIEVNRKQLRITDMEALHERARMCEAR